MEKKEKIQIVASSPLLTNNTDDDIRHHQEESCTSQTTTHISSNTASKESSCENDKLPSSSPTSTVSSKQQRNHHDTFKLIHFKQWDEIKTLFRSSAGHSLYQQNKDTHGINKITCLSMAVGVGAPLDVISAMVDADPNLATVRDEFGATVLHVGCLNGAGEETVSFILSKYPHLAEAVDCDERNALHHAIEWACLGKNGEKHIHSDDGSSYAINDGSSEVDVKLELQPYLNVIRILCKARPEMVHEKDHFNNTPIDLVQHLKVKNPPASEEYRQLDLIYQVLDQTRNRFYMEEKRKWEGRAVVKE